MSVGRDGAGGDYDGGAASRPLQHLYATLYTPVNVCWRMRHGSGHRMLERCCRPAPYQFIYTVAPLLVVLPGEGDVCPGCMLPRCTIALWFEDSLVLSHDVLCDYTLMYIVANLTHLIKRPSALGELCLVLHQPSY